MGNHVLGDILAFAGLFLIFFFLSEDFQQWLPRLRAGLRQRPRWKWVAYPAVALLFTGAAALIIRAMMIFAALRFAYD